MKKTSASVPVRHLRFAIAGAVASIALPLGLVAAPTPAHAIIAVEPTPPDAADTTPISVATTSISIDNGDNFDVPIYFEFYWGGGDDLDITGTFTDTNTDAFALALYAAGSSTSVADEIFTTDDTGSPFTYTASIDTASLDEILSAGDYDIGITTFEPVDPGSGDITFNTPVDAPAGVPEPGTLALFGSAALGLGLFRRKRA